MADSFPNVKRHVHCGFCLQEFGADFRIHAAVSVGVVKG